MLKFPENIRELSPQHEDFIRRVVEPRVQPVRQASYTFASTYTTSPAADVRIRHRLGQVPKGFRVISDTAAAIVWNGATANDRWFLYLRSDTADHTVTVEIF